MLFLKLNDGTCHHQLQAVVPRTICHTVHVGSALRLRGHWVPSIGKQQQMEFLAEQCLFVNESSEFVLFKELIFYSRILLGWRRKG